MILARDNANAKFGKEALNTVATSIRATADAVKKKPER
jgi:hypothetical protein